MFFGQLFFRFSLAYAIGRHQAYNRSKLGNFWVARELQRRYPRLNVFIVHPGLLHQSRRGRRAFKSVKTPFDD